MPEITETFFAADRGSWRAWLEKHHGVKKEIWLIFFKKHTGKACVSYPEAVEEALCFGWIDGILKRIDDKKHTVRFTPRKPRSRWSELNKTRVRRMIREGRMAKLGMDRVRDAKRSGEWQKTYEREADHPVPELERALADDPAARENFESFPPSARKMYRVWILDAKREETRLRRIREVVRRAALNQKPGIE